MWFKLFVFLVQFFIIYIRPKNAEPLLGNNIRQVQHGEYPAVVCIAKVNDGPNWQDFVLCTGILLSRMFVLSTDNCFHDEDAFEISMGSHYVSIGTKYYGLWWISYHQWNKVNGIPPKFAFAHLMLIKIYGQEHNIHPSTFGTITKPDLMYGLNADTVGCGKINSNEMPAVYHTASVKIISVKECKAMIAKLTSRMPIVNENFYCSIGEPHTYLDKADTGGPLYYFGVVLGINAGLFPRVVRKNNTGHVNIHINLFLYSHFITVLMKDDHIH